MKPAGIAPTQSASQAIREETGFYEAYAQFARNLRTWFLAYGVGAPVIFLTNEAVGRKLLASGQAEIVAFLFLSGVAIQVLAALLYKCAMWCLYTGERNNRFKTSKRYKCSDWVSESLWVEFGLDVLTIVLFAAATWLALKAALV